jgi:glycosyltransferase involved in cell wall biosynthesis
MRVAQVDPLAFTPPYDDGLCAALARRGHEVNLLTSRFLHGPTPAPRGYAREEVFLPLSGRLFASRPRSPLRIPLKAAEYGPSAWRALRRVRALRPDVVHLQWLPLPRLDRRWLGRLAADVPTVFTAHDVLPRRTADQVDMWLEIFRTVARVVVHSERSCDSLVGLGVEPERIAVIDHPVFDDPGGPAPAAPNGTTLLFFGLIREYKGLDVLLRALPGIAQRVPDARLVVAGDPIEPVEPLQTLAAELGVAERVEWRLRFVPREEVAALMAAATVAVLPYRQIDASGVLADALGHGRPAVVSDLGQVGETVRRFGAGAAVPPEDPAALAAACARLLEDREALAAAFAGVERARAALTWDAAAEAHERLYESLRDGP